MRTIAATHALLCALTLAPPLLAAQAEERAEAPARRLIVEPASLELAPGDRARISAHVRSADGEREAAEVMFFSRARRSVTVDADGKVEAVRPGEFVLVARTRRAEGADEDEEAPERLSVQIPVTVRRLPVVELSLSAGDAPLFTDTVGSLTVVALDERGSVLQDAEVELSSSAPEIASFDAFQRLHVHAPGAFSVNATSEGASVEAAFLAVANPVVELELTAQSDHARTGDVVHFTVTPRDATGRVVPQAPIQLAVAAAPDDDLGAPASGQVAPGRTPGDWRFVAETPGLYDVVATCGRSTARASVHIEPRVHSAELRLVGRGRVSDTHTSDLWVWEGVDGRDYVVTGTWGGNGDAHFWDVTDPSEMERIATVNVDARTVNDVKVSADGRLCVISREGASNRKNGIVLIDVVDPRQPKIIGTHDEGLTGGVHNVFIYEDHVFALSAGRRYDIVDVSDPSTPRTVSTYELETPGHSIHDVWVVDGLAYSSNWADGVHVVDVGNGIRGGSLENPVYVADYAYPSGWNHAAFPWRNEDTGRNYVVAGDEAFPYGLNVTGKPTYPRGWLHFIDFTDLEHPVEVARYQVPEAGTHNFWIEDDVAYVGYYNGGLRVIDLSGELMGDLYRQGREIDFLITDDPEGFIPNAPMVWGPQPHKGRIFFSDWNSGLWSAELVRERPE